MNKRTNNEMKSKEEPLQKKKTRCHKRIEEEKRKKKKIFEKVGDKVKMKVLEVKK